MGSRPHSWRFVGAVVIALASAACTGGGASVTTAGPAASTAASPAAERDFVRDIDVGGRTMSIACVGPTETGRPTVLFEAGLGGDRSGWGEAMTKLMATDRGCSYDRAGLGLSEPGPKPRTTDGQVDDLHALLGAAGIEPPYVFVGHSSGGWNVMVYAGRYPDEIAGVVFVDVRPPLASERFVAALPPASAVEPEPVHQTRADLTEWEQDPTRNPEGLDLIKSAGQAAASPGFGDRPLIVLTAGDRAGVTGGLPSELAKAFDEIWMDLQTKLVGLSSKGQQQIVAGATHDLPFEKPDVVIDAIREVLSSSGS
jgi:pimeloyl-ACP methyl ester carboxylesterase